MKLTIRRLIAFSAAVAAEILIVYLLLTWFWWCASLVNVVLTILSVLVVLYIIAYNDEATYKMLWLLLILTMPIPGTILFLMLGRKRGGKSIMRKLYETEEYLPPMIQEPWSPVCRELEERHKRLAASLANVERYTGYPVCRNEAVQYYPIGEELYAKMLEELKKAEKYIYCEYFIIKHGKMWDQMEKIMEEKAAQGVDVRVMWDDMGSLGTFDPREVRRLAKKKIHSTRFNPIKLLLGTVNYRDHRKMLIIDGVSAFSGGINLADEYINEEERFGHWKDIGFWITGDPVKSYTHMFVRFWNAFSEDKIPQEEYQEDVRSRGLQAKGGDGYGLSYHDTPLKESNISNDLYIDLLFHARKYVWFYTPYLLPGQSLMEALIKAARRGVDVRIVTPGIPDKKIVFRMTRSYYEDLIEAGVRIYEYTPGFIHAKACLTDDRTAIVGTANLDYRSLFLHYENNSVFVDSSMTEMLKTDMQNTMSKSREQELETIRRGFFGYLLDGILRVIAPLC